MYPDEPGDVRSIQNVLSMVAAVVVKVTFIIPDSGIVIIDFVPGMPIALYG